MSRNIRPVETAVVSITQVHAGDAYNVIPQRARLSGTVRVFSKQVMAQVEERMTALATSIAAGYGASATVDFRSIFAPTINDPTEAEYAAKICADLVGVDKVQRNPPLIMASEDFSYMLEKVPGCYLNIGNGGGGEVCEVHNPSYDFNDDALPLGASFFARLVEDRLASETA